MKPSTDTDVALVLETFVAALQKIARGNARNGLQLTKAQTQTIAREALVAAKTDW